MKKIRFLTLSTLILFALSILTPIAFAHPLGNFTINHYAGLTVSPDTLTIDYVLDMAEIPAFQEIATFDTNHNGQPEPAEVVDYPATRCTALRSELILALNHQPAALRLVSSAVEFPAGAGGLPTLRLSCLFQAPLTWSTDQIELHFKNTAFSERLGWREIVVTGQGVTLSGDPIAMRQSASQRLTAYPKDLLSSPLDQRELTLTLSSPDSSIAAAPSVAEARSSSQPPVNRNDGFTNLIALENLTPYTVLLALLIAFGWGAAHALAPGHGKTVVAAYLVGSRGTIRHALFLGFTTTITHTAGVFALGLLTLFASQFILPEQLYPWLGVTSGILVVTIGWSLVKARLSALIPWKNQPHHHHSHAHLDPTEGEHSHGHGHSHSHGLGSNHSHHPPGANDAPLTWRSLLALGVSGGLIPCPSALVVMLSAIALHRIGFGLLLIVAFSAGLASVLTVIGLMWLYAGRFFGHIPLDKRFVQVVPVLSALFVIVVGLGITVQALAQTGVLPATGWVDQVATLIR
jgi:ABC-type nickel/cobalt efflux system permease component RcnA